MKITQNTIDCFVENSQAGLSNAVDVYCDDVANSLWNKRAKLGIRIGEVRRDMKESGMEIALENIQWRMAAKLLNDIGVTRIRTSRKKA